MGFWVPPCRLFLSRTFTVALAVALLLASFGQIEAADPASKRVLMLHSFGPRFKPWSDYEQAIRSQISRQWPKPVDFVDQSLVSAAPDDQTSETLFTEYLRALYDRQPVDLIIAIGAPAAAFVQRHRERLFPLTPMVFTAVEQRRVQYEKLTENDTVVAIAHDFPAVFDNILRVLPLTKTIAIVNGTSPNEKFWQEVLRRELAPLTERVELRWYDGKSFEEILSDAAKLPPHSAIFWHLMNIDAAGVAHEANSALDELSSVANVPIFSYDGSFFDGRTVGGPMHSVLKSAQNTAAVAVRILNGELAGDIKTPPSTFAAPIFDWRQLQRWGIAESSLPPDSTIYFREPTLWERYWWQFALTAAVILAQTGLITGLLREHRRRKLAEVQSRQRTAELVHVNRINTAGELTASISHEINQPLGAILTNAETAQAILKSQDPDVAKLPVIIELKDIVDDILHDDRRASEVIQRLRSLMKKAPFELKILDFNDLIREAVEFVLAVGRKIKMEISITPEALVILGDRIQLQQVILNLVANGIDAMEKIPAENRVISIRTSRVNNFAQLSVSDRGSGIPEDKLKEVFAPFFSSKAEGMGMGLSIARTIVEVHNGKIWAENRDHGGATFRVRIPLSSDGTGPT
ncbi:MULTISPECIES: HAMP domain-containing sensor histidine kinase [unclassified Bradyrhizobium]|uniref:sensor histidine kinase n=1 Tax=unclassified Bradyrhizobium TaxID=2631580 RepID=UPI003395F660